MSPRHLSTRLAVFLALLSFALPLAAQVPVADPSRAEASYAEPHRPQFHFSPPTMWMNDPNGLVFHHGEWHLFYQYHPASTVWGPMHWGHAVSEDLVHWRHLPIALYPDERGYIFSGSAVVDAGDTSGFGKNGEAPLVAIFTYHDAKRGAAGATDHESQGIAWSVDDGRSWTKYEGIPVLPNPGGHKDFRDPNVFWHEPSGRWVMALSAGNHTEFWGSPDLKAWTHLSDFGAGIGAQDGVWECPDLFPLTIEGTDETRWVLIQNLNPGGPQGGSGTQYFIGDFDGTRFTLDPGFEAALAREGAVWLDSGRDNYAGITWFGAPPGDDRRVFIGWMGNWDYAQEVPTHPWRSAMTLPRTLTLHRTPRGLRVFSNPVRELEALRAGQVEVPPAGLETPLALTGDVGVSPARAEVALEFDVPVGATGRFGIELANDVGETFRLGLDLATGQYFSDRRRAGDHAFSDAFATGEHRAPRIAEGQTVRLRLYLDAASVELFADGGATVMTDLVFPRRPFSRLSAWSEAPGVRLAGGRIHPLRSVWQEKERR